MAQPVSTRSVNIDGHDVQFPGDMSDEEVERAIIDFKTRRGSHLPGPKPVDLVGEAKKSANAGWIGLGRGADKLVSGITQVLAATKGDKPVLRGLAEIEADKDKAYAPLQKEHPIATAVGESVPMAPFGPVGASVPGLLSYGMPDERLKAGALGSVGNLVGGIVGKGAARLLKPSGPVRGLSDDALNAAKRLHMKLSPGQQTGNPALLNFENYLARSPGSSSAMQVKRQAQEAALNVGAGKAIGAADGDLSETGFAVAKDAIGKEFQRLQAVTAPVLGPEFLKTLLDVQAENAARGSFRSASVDAMLDKGVNLAAQGRLTGEAYKQIRTVLTSNADAAFKGGDSIYGNALKTVRSALDRAAKGSLSEADRAAWDVTRAQWAAYKMLTKGNVTEAGQVSAPRVAAEMRRGSDALRTGAMKGPLADVARVGEAVKAVQNPNSGQLATNTLYSSPLTGVPLAAGNKVAQSIYTNPLVSSYLGGGVKGMGPRSFEGMTMAGRPFGTPAVQGWLGTPMMQGLLGNDQEEQ